MPDSLGTDLPWSPYELLFQKKSGLGIIKHVSVLIGLRRQQFSISRLGGPGQVVRAALCRKRIRGKVPLILGNLHIPGRVLAGRVPPSHEHLDQYSINCAVLHQLGFFWGLGFRVTGPDNVPCDIPNQHIPDCYEKAQLLKTASRIPCPSSPKSQNLSLSKTRHLKVMRQKSKAQAPNINPRFQSLFPDLYTRTLVPDSHLSTPTPRLNGGQEGKRAHNPYIIPM